MNISEYLGIKNIFIKESPTDLLVTSDRHVGCELERETINYIGNGSFFLSDLKILKSIPDGSLRKNGIELIFSEPLKGSRVIDALKELALVFKSYECTHSTRTSNHIHVNIQDFDADDLTILYNNYLVLEKTLFNLGKIKFNREDNTYCVPHWYYNEYSDIEIEKSIFYLFNYPKYLAMRLHEKFGTIEFRMFESTNSISKILRDINICLELVEISKKHIVLNRENLSRDIFKLQKTHKYLLPYLQESKPSLRINSDYCNNIFVKNKSLSRYSKYLDKKNNKNIEVEFNRDKDALSGRLNKFIIGDDVCVAFSE